MRLGIIRFRFKRVHRLEPSRQGVPFDDRAAALHGIPRTRMRKPLNRVLREKAAALRVLILAGRKVKDRPQHPHGDIGSYRPMSVLLVALANSVLSDALHRAI